MRTMASCFLMLILLATSSCYMPFDGPDVQHCDMAEVPENLVIADFFGVPDSADRVYYFTDSSLRCDYYLRFHVPDMTEYAEYKEHTLTTRDGAVDDPGDPSEAIKGRFEDWWDWRSSPEAESFRLGSNWDYVIFDDDRQVVFCVLSGD